MGLTFIDGVLAGILEGYFDDLECGQNGISQYFPGKYYPGILAVERRQMGHQPSKFVVN